MKSPHLTLAASAPDAVAGAVRYGGPREEVLAVYESHYTGLVRLAALLGNDRHAAEDLVHEAFIKLFSHWDELSHRSKAPAYLRSTIVNLARGRHRRHLIAVRKAPPGMPDTASAEDFALGRVRQQRVVDALKRLPARQRECLVLRHYAQLSESEIAETVGLSVGTVRTHLHRGLERLHTLLGAER